VKKLLKLLALVQAARHGRAYHAAGARKPWKRARWEGQPRHPYGHYGAGPSPYGRTRPRGLKSAIVEAVLHRLLRR
jgi:hypothetical protein